MVATITVSSLIKYGLEGRIQAIHFHGALGLSKDRHRRVRNPSETMKLNGLYSTLVPKYASDGFTTKKSQEGPHRKAL